RVQVQQQAADRRLHQLGVIDVIDVGFLDRGVDGDVAMDLAQRHPAVGGVVLLGGGGRLRFRIGLPGLVYGVRVAIFPRRRVPTFTGRRGVFTVRCRRRGSRVGFAFPGRIG